MRFYFILCAFLLYYPFESFSQDRWKAPAEADTLKNPYSQDNSEVIKKGEELYLDWCSSCHGLEGKGDGPAGQAFNPPPADFTSEQVQQQSDGALFWKVMEGNPPIMLSFKKILSEEEVWQVVTYLRKFGRE